MPRLDQERDRQQRDEGRPPRRQQLLSHMRRLVHVVRPRQRKRYHLDRGYQEQQEQQEQQARYRPLAEERSDLEHRQGLYRLSFSYSVGALCVLPSSG